MANYADLADLQDDSKLLGRVQVACVVAIRNIGQEATNTQNHAERLAWAKQAMKNPRGAALRMLPILLAQNAGMRVRDIPKLGDEQIQEAVDKNINLLT